MNDERMIWALVLVAGGMILILWARASERRHVEGLKTKRALMKAVLEELRKTEDEREQR